MRPCRRKNEFVTDTQLKEVRIPLNGYALRWEELESKRDDYPFAFLATYSTGLNKKGASKHLPLKYALEEFGRDSEKLLELLSTVNIAAKESPLISGLHER